MKRKYEVTLHFDSMKCSFVAHEVATSIPAAIAQAIRYAKACGFTGDITKKFVKEEEVVNE